MVRILFILVSFTSVLLTMIVANPCPCEVIVNEPLLNDLSTSILDGFIDRKFLENYFNRIPNGSSMETSSESFPLYQQEKYFDSSVQRNKRPSWAAVGKRSISYINKRPSWAQIG